MRTRYGIWTVRRSIKYMEVKGSMREELLTVIEKNSRIDLKELAVILGVQEVDVVNELAALEDRKSVV